MRSLFTAFLPAAALAAIPAGQLRGRPPDSVAFHRGHWGADFDIGSGFAGAAPLGRRRATQ